MQAHTLAKQRKVSAPLARDAWLKLRTCIHYFHRHLLCPKTAATALKMLARCPTLLRFLPCIHAFMSSNLPMQIVNTGSKQKASHKTQTIFQAAQPCKQRQPENTSTRFQAAFTVTHGKQHRLTIQQPVPSPAGGGRLGWGDRFNKQPASRQPENSLSTISGCPIRQTKAA